MSLVTQRIGGVAGIARGVVACVAVVGVVAAGGDQRANVVPFAMAVALMLVLGCLLGLRDAHRHRPQPILTAGYRLTFVGVAGAAGFYAALASSSTPPMSFLFENDTAQAVGVLVGSLIMMVVLPFGLLLLGVGFLKARVLPRWSRSLPLAVVLLLAGGAAGIAVVESDGTVVGAMVAVLGAVWVLLGVALLTLNGANGSSRSQTVSA